MRLPFLVAALLCALLPAGAHAFVNYDVFGEMKLHRPKNVGKVPHVGHWYRGNKRECDVAGKGMTVTDEYVERDGIRRQIATVAMQKGRPVWDLTFRPWRNDQASGDMSLDESVAFDGGPDRLMLLSMDEGTEIEFRRCPASATSTGGEAIPLVGTWSYGKPGRCVSGKDFRDDQIDLYPLTFTDKELYRYEWSGMLGKRTDMPNGTTRIAYTDTTEGQSVRSSLTVRFDGRDTLEIIAGKGKGRYYRCP